MLRGFALGSIGLSFLWMSCGDEIQPLAWPEPQPAERSAVWVVQPETGPPWAFAGPLPSTDGPSVLVESGAQARWTSFSCPLDTLGLSPGQQALLPASHPELGLPVPPPVRSLELASGRFVSRTQPDDTLARLPVRPEDGCRAFASRVEVSTVFFSGPAPEEDLLRADGALLDPNRGLWLLLEFLSIEDRELDQTVTTATLAQVHLMDLDRMQTERVPELEAMPLLEVSGLSDGEVLLSGRQGLVWYDWNARQTLATWSHPAFRMANEIEVSVRRIRDQIEGLILTDTEPRIFEGSRPPLSQRTLLRLQGAALQVLATSSIPYRSNRTALFSVEDGHVVGGLREDPNVVDFVDAQGVLRPVPLPSPPPNGWRLTRFFDALLVVDEFNEAFAWQAFQGSRWRRLSPSLSDQLGRFEAFERTARLGSQTLISVVDGAPGRPRFQMAEPTPLGLCPVAVHSEAEWFSEVVFPERQAWALVPNAGRPEGIQVFRIREPGPQCGGP